MAKEMSFEMQAHNVASGTKMLTSYERREVLAMDRLDFAEAIKKILKHLLEQEEKRAMDNAVQLHVASATREVSEQYNISELQMGLLERAKGAHLLQVRLDSALDDLELAQMQQQVLEAQVAEQESMLFEERAERQHVQTRLRLVREETQKERCMRLQAQREVDDIGSELKKNEAARVRTQQAARAKETEMQRQLARLQEQLDGSQKAGAARQEGARKRAKELEAQLAAKLKVLQKLEGANAAAQKDNKRLTQVIAEQRRELEVGEGEQILLRAKAQALEADLTTLRATHVALSAENGDLRMRCEKAEAEGLDKRTGRGSQESPTRNLGGALEEAAPQQQRRGKPGAGKAAQVKRAGGCVPVAVAGSPPVSSTAAIAAGANILAQEANEAAGCGKDDQERRVSPRFKRPISAESRQSARPPIGAVEKPSEREAKRAKVEPSVASRQGMEQALRAPLQAVSANTGGLSSQAEGSKAPKPKRTLAPSASKVLGKPPPRPEARSQFGKLFKKFVVPQLKLTSGTSSQEVDRVTLMSP